MDFISFQNPWAWALLPIAAVPWLLHLIKRGHFQKQDFSSLMLFEEQRVFIWRRSRLEEWLLLACRTLLLLSAIAALSGPVIRAGLPGWLSSAKENLVIICDDSASMGAEYQGASIWDAARTRMTDFLRGLGSSCKVAIVSGSRGNRLLSGFDSPSRAIGILSDIKPSELGTDLRGALVLADRMLQGRSSPLVVLASDLQKTAFGDTAIPLEKLTSGAKVMILPLGQQEKGPNLIWVSVRTSAIKRWLSVEARLSAGCQAESWPISLRQGDRVLMRLPARLGNDARIAVGLELPRADSLYLHTDDDALVADNRYYLAGGPGDIKNCLVICQPFGTEYQILSRALAAFSSVGYRSKFSAQPTLSELRQSDLFIVASERLLDQAIELLVREVGPTKGLIVIPPRRADRSSYNRLFSLMGSSARLQVLREDEKPFRLSASQEGFLGQASVHQVKVQRYWRISESAAEILVGGQDPGLIMERGRLCPLAIVTFGLDPEMSDFAYRPSFLVLLHRLLEFASDCCPRKQFDTGDSLLLDRRLMGRLIGPGGPVGGRMAGDLIAWPLERAGWYRLQLSNRRMDLAVNIPAVESELEALSSQRIKELFKNISWSYLKPESRFPEGRHGAWRFFIILTLAWLGLESILRMGMGAKKRLTTRDNYGKNIL